VFLGSVGEFGRVPLMR
jgi:transposase